MATTQSIEDYLERIYDLIDEKGYARVVDIASSLNIAQASVTKMIQKMDEEGYVKYEKYRGLTLTAEGAEVARGIKRRHKALAEFLLQLGLSPEEVEQDIEGIEHHLSHNTLETIESLAEFLRLNPKLLEDFKKFRNRLQKKD